MAEPKKETVRIALPPRPEQAGPMPSAEKRDTGRIVLPSRTPPAPPIRRPPPKISSLAPPEAANDPSWTVRRPPLISPSAPVSSPLLQPLPKPPGSAPPAPVRPTPVRETPPIPASSSNGEPKKETARVGVLPRPTSQPRPTVNMTKTQPVLIHPTPGIQPAPVVITSRPIARAEAIPRSLCWTLLAISAVIFLIQIWNYVVS